MILRTRAANASSIRVEETDRIEPWDKRRRKRQEMRTVGEEHDHGEVVSKQELSDASEDEKYAAEPDGRTCSCDSETAGATPSHW